MVSSSSRASAGRSTGVLPVLTTWVGPRTEVAGLVGITSKPTCARSGWAGRRCSCRWPIRRATPRPTSATHWS